MDLESKSFSSLENVTFSPSDSFRACTFRSCHFEKTNFSRIAFSNCTFQSCTFSGVILKEASFQEVKFVACKIAGFNFSHCSQLSQEIEFVDSMLLYCLFININLRHFQFSKSVLENCELANSDLKGMRFSETSLRGSMFVLCDLTRADFRTAREYCFDPSKNKLEAAQFSLPECAALLLPFGCKVEGFGTSDEI